LWYILFKQIENKKDTIGPHCSLLLTRIKVLKGVYGFTGLRTSCARARWVGKFALLYLICLARFAVLILISSADFVGLCSRCWYIFRASTANPAPPWPPFKCDFCHAFVAGGCPCRCRRYWAGSWFQTVGKWVSVCEGGFLPSALLLLTLWLPLRFLLFLFIGCYILAQ